MFCVYPPLLPPRDPPPPLPLLLDPPEELLPIDLPLFEDDLLIDLELLRLGVDRFTRLDVLFVFLRMVLDLLLVDVFEEFLLLFTVDDLLTVLGLALLLDTMLFLLVNEDPLRPKVLL